MPSIFSPDIPATTGCRTHVSQVVAATLAMETDHFFGVMGNGNAYLIEAMSELDVKFTSLRHEAGAVSAADAYHRISTRLGVATATYGAGFTNTITALQEAQMAATPLVLVTGDAPLSGTRPWDTDQATLAAAAGVKTFRIPSAACAQSTARAAVAAAYATLQPVVLSIPFDLAVSGVPDDAEDITTPFAGHAVEHVPALPELDHDLVLRAARSLGAAERPLVLAGRGARLAGAGQELARLAEQSGALTATTLLAQGLFGDTRTDLGVAGGFGRAWALERMSEADVVLVSGARLNAFTMHMGALIASDATVIQVDLHEASAHPRADLFLQGDARTVAMQLATALEGVAHTPGWRHTSTNLPDARTPDRSQVPVYGADGRLDPRSLASALDEALPVDRVLLQDLGNFVEWMPTRARLTGPGRTAMLGSAFQSIGLGLPGVVGAAAAEPDATVVLATGDGGLLMALADLESVVREASSCVVVVFNDAAYGAEVHQYGGYGVGLEPMLIADVDFAGLARALGAQGLTVRETTDLTALRDWVRDGSRGTMLLDCKVSLGTVSPVLEGIARNLERPSATPERQGNA